MDAFFDFEKPLSGLENKLNELRALAKDGKMDLRTEIENLEEKLRALTSQTYSNLTPWQRVQLSRHPNRPYARDIIDALFPDFMELHGDRRFGEDQAIVGGTATFQGNPILILGNQKGRTTKQRVERNFGMARPEGYRKAIRLMELADRTGLPILTLIDTPGAYPGADAEERGQAQAIAESISTLFQVRSPVCAVIIGEGGSGGALALGVADVLLMQEFSVYSVISPESCASILWSDSSLAERAAERLKMSPKELLQMGIIDQILQEPLGGAQRNWEEAFSRLNAGLEEHFLPRIQNWKKRLKKNPDARPTDLREARREKYRKMGQLAFSESAALEEGTES